MSRREWRPAIKSTRRAVPLTKPLTFVSLGKNNLSEHFACLGCRAYPRLGLEEHTGGTTRRGMFTRGPTLEKFLGLSSDRLYERGRLVCMEGLGKTQVDPRTFQRSVRQPTNQR